MSSPLPSQYVPQPSFLPGSWVWRTGLSPRSDKYTGDRSLPRPLLPQRSPGPGPHRPRTPVSSVGGHVGEEPDLECPLGTVRLSVVVSYSPSSTLLSFPPLLFRLSGPRSFSFDESGIFTGVVLNILWQVNLT